MSGVNFNVTDNKAADEGGEVPAGSVNLVVGESTLGATFTTTSTSLVDTGLSINVTTTKTNEYVVLSLIGYAHITVGASGTLEYAVKIDSDADRIISSTSALNGIAVNVNFSQAFQFATPGAHTVKFRMRGQVGETWNLNGAAASGAARFQTFQVQ